MKREWYVLQISGVKIAELSLDLEGPPQIFIWDGRAFLYRGYPESDGKHVYDQALAVTLKTTLGDA